MLYPLRENPCKEGSLVQLAKEFLTRFYIFFKSVDFVLLQEIQPFLHLLHQSSNSIFDFNLRASFARLSFQVNKTCWTSPKLDKRILAFFFKWVWRADFERFLKKVLLTGVVIESFFLYTLYTMYTMYTLYIMYTTLCTIYILYTVYTIHDVYIVYITWLYTKYILYMMYTIYTIYTYLLKNDIYLHDQIFVLHFGIQCIQYIHITHFIHIYYQDEIIEGMIADWISNLFSVRKLDINWNVTVNEMEFKMSFLMSKVHFFCNYPYIL